MQPIDKPDEAVAEHEPAPSGAPRAPRLKPGERRVHILQTLAAMLEAPKSEKITTAALAARLGVSEAALYRHFASKAQMFEGNHNRLPHPTTYLKRSSSHERAIRSKASALRSSADG
ncbi:TetR family transcriptional regulator, partial [Paraburkholderia aspalathi]|uniref:TetR family transcriptional regulator n=1 Tax=Paraburkholderia aspalathi TaxID=1324617 RepID=UPI001F47A0D1